MGASYASWLGFPEECGFNRRSVEDTSRDLQKRTSIKDPTCIWPTEGLART